MLNVKAWKWFKVMHLASVSACVGGVFSLCVMMWVKYCLGDELDPVTVDTVLLSLFEWGFMASLYAAAATGLIYSLFTDWGFLKHRWIIVKWTGVVFLAIAAVFWLGPAVNGMAALADGFFSINGAATLYKQLFRQAAFAMGASLGVLIFLILVSVLKPWGRRVRKSRTSPKAVRWVWSVIALVSAALIILGSVSLEKYRSTGIRHVEPSALGDGVYEGEASDGSFTYRVRVTIAGGLMTGIEAAANRDSLYARVAEGVFAKAINLQSPRADAITGATTTSWILLKAVENALTSKEP